jgi:hypothetical protein
MNNDSFNSTGQSSDSYDSSVPSYNTFENNAFNVPQGSQATGESSSEINYSPLASQQSSFNLPSWDSSSSSTQGSSTSDDSSFNSYPPSYPASTYDSAPGGSQSSTQQTIGYNTQDFYITSQDIFSSSQFEYNSSQDSNNGGGF